MADRDLLSSICSWDKEVTLVNFALELEEEALPPDHAEDIAKGDDPVVDGVHGVERGYFPGLVQVRDEYKSGTR